jgi:hypothetical protein
MERCCIIWGVRRVLGLHQIPLSGLAMGLIWPIGVVQFC